MLEGILSALRQLFKQLNSFGQNWYGLLLLFGSLLSFLIVVLHYSLLRRHAYLNGKIDAVKASVDRVDKTVNGELEEYTKALIEGYQSIQELADDLKVSRRSMRTGGR